MPLTIEFLLCFLATAALVFILSSTLFEKHESIAESMEKRKEISRARSAARTIESWLNCGRITSLDFQDENLTFRIEGRLIVAHKEEFIEVGGIFVNDLSEPI